MGSMYVGVSGIKAANVDLQTTSHNVANSGTTGFKNSRAEFGDLVAGGCGGGFGIVALEKQFGTVFGKNRRDAASQP